jgi:hypothetical protein
MRTRQRRTVMNLDHKGRTLAARGLFLAAALLSFGLSVVLYFTGEHTDGIFVGLWVPLDSRLGCVPRPPARPGPGRRLHRGGRSNDRHFLYGVFVFALVSAALGLVGWGIRQRASRPHAVSSRGARSSAIRRLSSLERARGGSAMTGLIDRALDLTVVPGYSRLGLWHATPQLGGRGRPKRLEGPDRPRHRWELRRR